MFGFVCFCIQLIFIQQICGQAMNAPAGVNNGIPNSYGNGQNIPLTNQGYSGQMIQGQQFGPMGPQYSQPAGQVPTGINPGYSAYGGNGNGDVTVIGELPVVGNTAVTGNVPLTGKVQFTGSIPAGGIVTISGQCGCGCNGQTAPYGAKTSYTNKPFY